MQPLRFTFMLAILILSLTASATEAPTATKAHPGNASTVRQSSTTNADKATSPRSKKTESAEEAALMEKFIVLQDAAIGTFLELGGTLRGVKNRESADAAAPTVRQAAGRLCTIITAVGSLGEPSEATQQAIMARIANLAEKKKIEELVMLPMLNLMMGEPPCFGSESLMDELTRLLANLQGAAGVNDPEEEEAAPLQEPERE